MPVLAIMGISRAVIARFAMRITCDISTKCLPVSMTQWLVSLIGRTWCTNGFQADHMNLIRRLNMATRGSRKKPKPSNPNPLFCQWLQEWKDEADTKGWKTFYTYGMVNTCNHAIYCCRFLLLFSLGLTLGWSFGLVVNFLALLSIATCLNKTFRHLLMRWKIFDTDLNYEMKSRYQLLYLLKL